MRQRCHPGESFERPRQGILESGDEIMGRSPSPEQYLFNDSGKVAFTRRILRRHHAVRNEMGNRFGEGSPVLPPIQRTLPGASDRPQKAAHRQENRTQRSTRRSVPADIRRRETMRRLRAALFSLGDDFDPGAGWLVRPMG